ncbi:ABC transporter, ATP-binding protein [Pseudoalteromonas luteoviolacea B = ATCC 29581]|nr:ABC transporter, ATP-binding protein [Pseudoalteromonas luteoviolacea B = ATCC 29581]
MTALLKLQSVTKKFETHSVLNKLNLTVEPGMVIGLLGKNGAGKSTLMRIALGLDNPSEGNATCFGESSRNLSISSRSKIGYVPQQPFGYEGFSVAEALKLHASFYSNWDFDLESLWLNRFELNRAQRVDKLSVGQRQCLALIMAMAYRPELLVLDEPVASLDPLTRREFMSDLFELALESQSGILFSSHITTDLERVASHIALIKSGQIILFEEADSLKDKIRKVVKGTTPLDLSRYTVLNDSKNASLIYGYEGETISGAKQIIPLSLEQIFIEVHQNAIA